jgi:hypothetical protein
MSATRTGRQIHGTVGGSAIRDYDRPQRFSNGKCWNCGAWKREALVEEATALQCKVHGVPAGASLCIDCGFVTEEQEAAARVDWVDEETHKDAVRAHKADERESFVENNKAWEREEGWGGF